MLPLPPDFLPTEALSSDTMTLNHRGLSSSRSSFVLSASCQFKAWGVLWFLNLAAHFDSFCPGKLCLNGYDSLLSTDGLFHTMWAEMMFGRRAGSGSRSCEKRRTDSLTKCLSMLSLLDAMGFGYMAGDKRSLGTIGQKGSKRAAGSFQCFKWGEQHQLLLRLLRRQRCGPRVRGHLGAYPLTWLLPQWMVGSVKHLLKCSSWACSRSRSSLTFCLWLTSSWGKKMPKTNDSTLCTRPPTQEFTEDKTQTGKHDASLSPPQWEKAAPQFCSGCSSELQVFCTDCEEPDAPWSGLRKRDVQFLLLNSQIKPEHVE